MGWRSLLRINIGRYRAASQLTKRSFSGFSSLSPKTLSDVVKLELFAEESADRCKEIWSAYHSEKKDSSGISVTKEVCNEILQRAKKCPMFVFPIYKGLDAYLMMLCQFQNNIFLFTYLEEYKSNPSTASPWMSIAVYDDLLVTKGMGLMRSDFMPSISKKEATVLNEMLIDAYGPMFAKHTEPFNIKPESFYFETYSKDMSSTYSGRFLSEPNVGK